MAQRSSYTYWQFLVVHISKKRSGTLNSPANGEPLLRKLCAKRFCNNVSPFARGRNICCGKKNVSEKRSEICFAARTQKVFPHACATNVPSGCKRGDYENNFPATKLPQQCFLVCGGLRLRLQNLRVIILGVYSININRNL